MNKHQKIINKITKVENKKHEEMYGYIYSFREGRISVKETLWTKNFNLKKHYYKRMLECLKSKFMKLKGE